MIINSINSVMANSYKRSSKPAQPQFRGAMSGFNTPVEQPPTPQNPKFVSDLKQFSFLKNLFK
jgi:hypothetical protein